jgi:CheY-like chemotaxis protein
METGEGTFWFLGDLDDPWVKAILSSCAEPVTMRAIMCAGPIPARPFGLDAPPAVVLLHRTRLSPADVHELECWRLDPCPSPFPWIVLCSSPYIRYADLERAARSVDLLITEATAFETLPRHLERLLRGGEDPPRPKPAATAHVDLVSSDHALRDVLAESLRAAGYRVGSRAALDEPLPKPGLTVWDVPVLDSGWPAALREQSRLGPVIALLGFADRETVRRARASGAVACLDVPFELDDLIFVLDRVHRSMMLDRSVMSPVRIETAHPLPPAPTLPRRTGHGMSAARRDPRS